MECGDVTSTQRKSDKPALVARDLENVSTAIRLVAVNVETVLEMERVPRATRLANHSASFVGATGSSPTCEGSGYHITTRCTRCAGSGKCEFCRPTGPISCPACLGHKKCMTCQGSGNCRKCRGAGRCQLCVGNGYQILCDKCSGTTIVGGKKNYPYKSCTKCVDGWAPDS